MTEQHFFIEPLDALLLRGNQLFGDAGSYGDSHMPPWPSVTAGALRSHLLASSGADLAAFAAGTQAHPSLGTPTQPGSFALSSFGIARQAPDGQGIERLFAPPTDVFLGQPESSDKGDGQSAPPQACLLHPTGLHHALATSCALPQLPVLAQAGRSKPASGWWLREAGWLRYLQGHAPDSTDLVSTADLWRMDERIGVGLDAGTRSAQEGRLFANRAVAFKPGVGFVASITGLGTPMPAGMLRLGGDGRAAILQAVPTPRAEDFEHMAQAICQQRRCRLVLTSPGLFAKGWLPNGFVQEEKGWRFDLHGVKGRLLAAAVARSEVVSGWDLAHRQPKPAQRIAPTGSVYWLDEVQASPDSLHKLVTQGLWSNPCEDAARRAEGFNRLSLALFPR
ncbi:type III-B CRISPR module-associated Cmr3 family protein [Vandammella animalimorsus]|uniref:Type III-B CRISPR module-associated protein Cmr3 n=1 Tax=Vandammella animalimorsus TaxID=2029117 RepID=A0A2A2AY18_9BURK|nr:type III-B CRISPR module-associated Cmr3 family protein [Vandammella animalimorsus]PAT42638.1 type III-B CRISPR module-associated protein Cmr3 [Vandammella animalimorsus]